MALNVHTKIKKNGVTWQSGHIYSFKYSAWSNDPNPTIIFINAFSGTHPSTLRQWRFIQGINFTYIPRTYRKQFAKAWVDEWQRNNGRVEITWGRIENEFPFLTSAIRRYFYTPSYYIQNPKHIALEDMENVIVSTWSKDFSKKIKTDLVNKYKRAMQGAGRNKSFFSNLFGRG